jgi:hypothetical protein
MSPGAAGTLRPSRCGDLAQEAKKLSVLSNLFRLRAYAFGAILLTVSGVTKAHFFVQSYSLPIPFSLYAGGAGVALFFSFIAVAALARAPQLHFATGAVDTSPSPASASGAWGRALSVSLLALCVVTGVFGTTDAFRNINMTLFWVVFLLAIAYAIALLGDFYAAVNPWGTLVSLFEKASGADWKGRLRYPDWLGHFPALLFYVVLIELELFGQLKPFGLAMALVAYTGLMLLGAWVFGKRTWIDHAEVFGQFFRLLGLMSFRAAPALPIGARRRRLPFAAVLRFRPADWGTVLFILFMLSSTAFDGVHGTLPWSQLYWKEMYPHIKWIDQVMGAEGGNQYAASTHFYYVWQWICLVLSPFLYAAVFVIFVWAARAAAKSSSSLGELVFQFVPSLLPIALVYHLSHYYTLLLWQAPQMIKLASDPFGVGWNLFGTAKWNVAPLVVDVGTIWHTQVFLIVFGHMISVLLAHFEALHAFRSRTAATLSQMPVLALMIMFTASGLWILSLPLSPS